MSKYYEKLESNTTITKQVNTKLSDKMRFLELQCWPNEQYSRCECLEIFGVPESVLDNNLEGQTVNLLAKLDVEVPPDYVEAYHWLKSNAGLEKVVIKM